MPRSMSVRRTTQNNVLEEEDTDGASSEICVYGSDVGQPGSCVNTTYDTSVDNPVGTALVELLTDQRRPAFAGVYIVEAASDVRAAAVINDTSSSRASCIKSIGHP